MELASEAEGTYSPDSRDAGQSGDNEFSEPLLPIPMPPEFAKIPSNKVYWHHDHWRELHSQLEREPIDPAWAATTEAVLRNAFGENQNIMWHGTPTFTCRTTMCQVQMMAYGAPDVDEGEWSTHFGDVHRTLRSDFDIADFSVAQESGATAMVLHLTRRKEPGAK